MDGCSSLVRVLARRLLAFALVFLVVSTIVGAIAPAPRERRATKPPPSRVVPAVEATGELPADETVRARVGDVVVLRVRAPAADVVRIDALGLDADASPELPARLEFVAARAGRFPVVLEVARKRVGTLVVTGPA